MSTRAIRKLAAASVLAFAASASQAALENSWNYTLELNWITSSVVFNPGNGPNDPNHPGSTTVSEHLLSWGALGGNYLVPDTDPGKNHSALEITDPSVSGTIVTNGASVAANMFTHYNSPIWSLYPDLAKAQLSVSIALTSLDGAAFFKIDRVFEVNFKETPNTGLQCGYGLCDNDIFAIVSIAPTLDNLTSSFTFGGYEYTFNYFETTNNLKPLAAAACEAAGIATGRACYGFTTPESMATAVQFGFSVTAVPEPETYAMLLAGLGMIGVVVRRRRNTTHN